jgi:hypothetical protein
MDSKINTGDTGLRVKIDQSRTRQAPRTDFGSMVSTGLNRTAGAVMDAGQLAAPFIPGGAVLSAAISGVGSLKSSAAGQSLGATGSNATGLMSTSGAVGSVGATGASSSGLTPSAGGSTDAFANGRQFLEMQASFNMQYLMLQQQMQSENRQFTTLSNVMKTKHDTAKNAISNVR